MTRGRDQLDWDRVALGGDVGAVPPALAPRCTASAARRRRSRKLTIAVLLAWLAWEGAGLVRALTIGPPILQAMWDAAEQQGRP